MITDPDLDRILSAWLADGPERAPAQDTAAALRQVDRTSQRHGILGGRGTVSTLAANWWRVAAALVVVVVVAALAVAGSRSIDTIGRSTDVVPGGIGVNFGTSARISQKWFVDENTAFTAVLPAGTPRLQYWRAATFNRFNLSGWDQTGLREVPVAAGQPLVAGMAELPDPTLTKPISFSVRPASFQGSELLSPGTPTLVDRPTTVRVAGDPGWLAGVELAAESGDYTVDAEVLRLDDSDLFSADRLIAAPEVYPSEIVALYTDVPDGALGPDANLLLQQVKDSARSSDPYDLVTETVRILGDPSVYHYDTDVSDLDCTMSQVECLARYKRGYCLHYASTMAMLLRAANPANPIPTRLVEGFLPGDRVGSTETVANRQAHAWVEVYFPGFGWMPFDPTPGGGVIAQ